MDGAIQIFNNPQFGEVRINNDNGKPLFMASDVAKALGYINPLKAIRDHCKGVNEMDTPTPGGIQSVKFIPESDVYRLVMRSKLPTAEMFQDWVMDEVLPAIRKDGGYIVTKEDDTDESILARALIIANNTMNSLKAKNRLLEACNQDNVKRLEEQAPKVLFADAMNASQNSILIRELAKLITQNGVEIGEKRLFDWLRSNEYLCRVGESRNLPTQRSMEQGLMEIKKTTRIAPNGTVFTDSTPKITGKGQLYFVNKFLFQKK